MILLIEKNAYVTPCTHKKIQKAEHLGCWEMVHWFKVLGSPVTVFVTVTKKYRRLYLIWGHIAVKFQKDLINCFL